MLTRGGPKANVDIRAPAPFRIAEDGCGIPETLFKLFASKTPKVLRRYASAPGSCADMPGYCYMLHAPHASGNLLLAKLLISSRTRRPRVALVARVNKPVARYLFIHIYFYSVLKEPSAEKGQETRMTAHTRCPMAGTCMENWKRPSMFISVAHAAFLPFFTVIL